MTCSCCAQSAVVTANMADSKGSTSKEGLSDWCILEAECSDLENDFEQLFEQDTDSDVSDLLDNGELEQGNSLELFHQQAVSYTHLTLPTTPYV